MISAIDQIFRVKKKTPWAITRPKPSILHCETATADRLEPKPDWKRCRAPGTFGCGLMAPQPLTHTPLIVL
jgi:hypothetical protein